jgi:hypothetical protein
MESQIWVKSEEKWAYILMLRGHEVHKLRISGNMMTLKGKVGSVVAALEEGKDPLDVGANSVETLDARTMNKAEISLGNCFLTLYGGGDSPHELTFEPTEDNADEILQAVLANSDLDFQPTQEQIGVDEALLPPVLVGGLAGVLWYAVHMTAGHVAAAEKVQAKKVVRRQDLHRMLVWVSETLGTDNTIALGVILLALILGWAAVRVIHRPERTVWIPKTA